MNKLNSKATSILLLVVYLLFVVVMGTGGVMLLLDYADIYLILFAVGFTGFLICMFIIECYTGGYKLKYYFLGKNYRSQVNQYFNSHPSLSKKEKQVLLKQFKDEYRKTGSIHITEYLTTQTPNKIWTEDNLAFNYGNALEQQKLEYIVYTLHLNCLTGGGLYRAFEELSAEPFSYEEYAKLVKTSNLFSKELKKYLLTKTYKDVFDAFKVENLTATQDSLLQSFEETDSSQLFDFQEELFVIVEKFSVDTYLNIMQTHALPDGTTRLFVSKDKYKRICIYLDSQTQTYKINQATFFFYDPDVSPMLSEGSWSAGEHSSFFATEQLALNEIKTTLADYTEIKF